MKLVVVCSLVGMVLLCFVASRQSGGPLQIRQALTKGEAHVPHGSKIDLPQQTGPVTYGFSGGRLGDNLLAYLHARWIAYRDGVPLVYRPFPQAEAFALSQEMAVEAAPPLEIPYFPEPSQKNGAPLFTVPWDDPGFRQEVCQCLQPTSPHKLLTLPEERITICVHVRRGGMFDAPEVRVEYPLKFPPDSYYIEQIARVAQVFRGLPLYVFLMTDDLDPPALLRKYQNAVPLEGIAWGCRKEPPVSNLDDFFSIPLFDCLILCDSNFSLVASKLGRYALRITPVKYRKRKGSVQITDVEVAYQPTAKIRGFLGQ